MNTNLETIARNVLRIPPINMNKDYYNGFNSGKMHDKNNPLYKANEIKARSALQDPTTPIRVMQYWLGYSQGMTLRAQQDTNHP